MKKSFEGFGLRGITTNVLIVMCLLVLNFSLVSAEIETVPKEIPKDDSKSEVEIKLEKDFEIDVNALTLKHKKDSEKVRKEMSIKREEAESEKDKESAKLYDVFHDSISSKRKILDKKLNKTKDEFRGIALRYKKLNMDVLEEHDLKRDSVIKRINDTFFDDSTKKFTELSASLYSVDSIYKNKIEKIESEKTKKLSISFKDFQIKHKKLNDSLYVQIERSKDPHIFDKKNWQNLLYFAFGTSLDFLSGVSAKEKFYDVSFMMPQQFHQNSFYKNGSKYPLLNTLTPSGFGFTFAQGRTFGGDSLNLLNSTHPYSLGSHIHQEGDFNDETKIQVFIFWGSILDGKETKSSLRPALLGEFRQVLREQILINKVELDTLLQPLIDTLVDTTIIRLDNRSTEYYIGPYLQAEALNMNISAFFGWTFPDKDIEIIQVTAVHKKYVC